MQGINAKEHQLLIEAFKRFEELAQVADNKITQEHNKQTREGVKELRMLYLRFNTLLLELEQSTKRYKKKRKMVQSIMYKSIRKMNAEVKRNNRYK